MNFPFPNRPEDVWKKKLNIWTESLRESQRARHTSLLSEQTAIFPQWNKVNTKSSAESSAKAPPPEIILEQIDPKVACQALRLRSQESVEMKKNKRRECKKKKRRKRRKKWRGDRGEIESAGRCNVSKQRGYVRRVPRAFSPFKRGASKHFSPPPLKS